MIGAAAYYRRSQDARWGHGLAVDVFANLPLVAA
jgi:hypothetical protein